MTHISRLTVYLRSPIPAKTERRQAAVLGRVDSLRQQGLVDEVVVSYWSRLAAATDREEAVEIAAMEAWATAHDCSLAPGLDHRDRHSAFTGDEALVFLPVVCLACWDDEEIVSVYPHRGPAGHCTVEDGLNRIESTLHSEGRYNGSQR